MPRSARLRPVDLAGIGLAAAFGGWMLVSAAANDGSRPWPSLLAIVAAALALAGGRALRRAAARTPTGTTVALAALAGAIAAFSAVLDVRAAGGGPLGYGNANGALFAALGGAVVLVRVTARAPTRRTREAAAALALLAGAACALSGSAGAVGATAIGSALVSVTAATHRRWVSIPISAAVVTASVGVVFAVALGAGPDALGSDTFGTRARLWREAAEIAGDHWATGVGPGRFQAENTASNDADLRRAHSAPLQTAAELGLPGLTLLLGLGGWVTAALWAVRDEPEAGVGVAAFTALALQAGFDWVLAEPVVLVVAAAVVGAATTSFAPPVSRLPRRLPGTQGSLRLQRSRPRVSATA